MRTRFKTLLPLTVLAAIAAPAVYAGCLAPSDAVVDGAGAVGVFWGSGDGELFYARNVTGNPELVRRKLGQASEIVAQAGVRNDFLVGSERETWTTFHSGTVSSQGDLAFVASTTIDDDPSTNQNEGLARRGAYAQRGNTLVEIGRFGNPSPIRGQFGEVLPWASFFDAVAEERGPNGRSRVVFTAQIGAPDGRIGIFRWDEDTFESAPIVMVGEPSPAGGTLTTIGRMRANESGDIAFLGLSQVGEDLATPGLFLALADGSRLRIVRFGTDGDAAPTRGAFSILNDFAIADDGTVAFAATVANGAGSGLYRASPPSYQPSVVAEAGDSTPIGGSFESFEAAKVRLSPDGDLVFGAPLSNEVGGEGLFVIRNGSSEMIPLANPDTSLGVASIGADRGAYQTQSQTRTVTPADGDEEGLQDFRLAKLDVKNNIKLRTDSVKFQGAFQLPSVGDGAGDVAPVIVGPGSFQRAADGRVFAGDELTRILRVHVKVSDFPGNEFVFGFDAGGNGTLEVNGIDEKAPKVKQANDGSSVTWRYTSNLGSGKFTLDVADGTFDFRLARGSIRESFEPSGFKIALTLSTDDDVAAGREGDEAFFHHAQALNAQLKPFGTGRRIVSTGEGSPLGTLFVDDLRVKRKLKVSKGQATPTVDSDVVKLVGTLRLCAGGTPPATPGLSAAVTLGDLQLTGLQMSRRGRSGSKYRYKSPKGASPVVKLDVDVVKGTFKIKVKGATPLSQLVDADFSGASATNGAGIEVGGMDLPFSIRIERVYEGAFDVPMRRLRGGKTFQN